MVLLCALPFLTTSALNDEVFLEVFNGASKIGVTSYKTHMLSSGGKRSVMDLQLSAKGQSGRFTTTQEVDSEGRQVKVTMVIAQVIGKQSVNATLVANISSDGTAKIRAKTQSNTREKTLPAPKGASIKDPTELWFIQNQPKPGTVATFYHFSAENAKWELIKAVYKGKQTIKSHGATLSAHYVEQSRGANLQKMYFDNKGLPILITAGTIRMERQ